MRAVTLRCQTPPIRAISLHHRYGVRGTERENGAVALHYHPIIARLMYHAKPPIQGAGYS
eukprot:2424954-Rhodomonas_salina.2